MTDWSPLNNLFALVWFMNILIGHTMIAGMLSIVYKWNYTSYDGMAYSMVPSLYKIFEIQIMIKLNA
jgi:hypothetical protein